jgi:hypothetical protein
MKNDGGAAFPVPPLPDRTDEMQYGAEGMSLRDWFAGQFAAAWVVALSVRHGEPGWLDADAAIVANRLGLAQADAMLAEREKGGKT